MVKVGCTVTKVRLEPRSEGPVSCDAEASLPGGRSAAEARTASKAGRTDTRFKGKNIGFRGCLAALVALAVVSGAASSSKFFQAATQADFLKGDVENLSIDSQGRLVLGPATELVYETSAPFLWALTAGADGSLFVGTGNEGKVFRIDPQGKGSVFFDSSELEVHALALAPNGGLYVATSPEGRIYKVDRDGKDTVFFDPDDKYIWSLAVDAKGNVFAGTGEKGVIYKITPDGKGTKFYDTKATHASALVFDKAGNLMVGTGTPGRVLRVDPDGKGFVVLDSPYDEIRTMRFDDKGMLYVAALSGRTSSGGGGSLGETVTAPPADSGRTLTPSVTVEVTSIALADGSSTGGTSSSSSSSRESRRASKGAVYRIPPDGLWDQLWDSKDDAPYDLAFASDGALVVGTGNKGKIYRLDGNPVRPMLLARGAAQQVTAFFKDPRGRLYYATANPGKVFRLSSERATRGTYESEPRDAQMVSTWGTLSWRGVMSGSNQIEVFTRSGNTETPDETWSAWSSAYKTPEGATITSPKARYLQWRAVLTGRGEGPVLTSIAAAYLQRNLRPVVRSITVHPPGIVFQKPFTSGEPELAGFDDQTTPDRKLTNAAMSGQQSSPSLGRRTYQKGLQTLVWKADDENDDDLAYDVLYRREGETTWRALRRGMTDSILVWDTTTVPNGTYFVRIVASDLPSNPAGTALAGELDSSVLEIDNAPPQIVIQNVKFEGGRTTITFDVKDDHSAVQRVEYSSDGQRWTAVFPTDGVADSKLEHYELVIGGELGDRGLTLRASDTMNNVANGHVDPPSRR
jgi:sugar lactone lactonase YvrE